MLEKIKKNALGYVLIGVPVAALSAYGFDKYDETSAIKLVITQFEAAQAHGKELIDKFVTDNPDSQPARDEIVREAFIKAKKEGRELSFEEYALLKNGKKFEAPVTVNRLKATQDSLSTPENDEKIQKAIKINRESAEAVLAD